MRQYTAEKYENQVEHIDNPVMQHWMQTERDFIARTPDAQSRTFVDLGAGYGRIVGNLAGVGKDVIAIEINPEMYTELEQRASQYSNVTSLQGDFLHLDELLASRPLSKPVFVIAQNSLGTIEGGDYSEVLGVVKSVAQKYGGELVLSLLRAGALKDWGIQQLYSKISDMVGELDPDATDTDKGLFVSKTGYTSKWWTDTDIEQLKGLGQVADEVVEPKFQLLRLSF